MKNENNEDKDIRLSEKWLNEYKKHRPGFELSESELDDLHGKVVIHGREYNNKKIRKLMNVFAFENFMPGSLFFKPSYAAAATVLIISVAILVYLLLNMGPELEKGRKIIAITDTTAKKDSVIARQKIIEKPADTSAAEVKGPKLNSELLAGIDLKTEEFYPQSFGISYTSEDLIKRALDSLKLKLEEYKLKIVYENDSAIKTSWKYFGSYKTRLVIKIDKMNNLLKFYMENYNGLPDEARSDVKKFYSGIFKSFCNSLRTTNNK